MKIYIPKPTTRIVPQDVYASIHSQKVIDCEVIEVIAGCDLVESVEHRVRSRNLILSIAESVSEPFFVVLDSDTVIMGEDGLFLMYNELVKTPKLGAVSLRGAFLGSTDSYHVDIACMMVRLEAVKGVKFKSQYGSCECNFFKHDLMCNGFEYRYLDDIKRTKTVKEGVLNGR